MQGNSGYCHLILNTSEFVEMLVGESLTESTNCEKLLDVKNSSKFIFEKHIKTVCKKASNKLRAFPRVTPYMIIGKKDFNESNFQLS